MFPFAKEESELKGVFCVDMESCVLRRDATPLPGERVEAGHHVPWTRTRRVDLSGQMKTNRPQHMPDELVFHPLAYVVTDVLVPDNEEGMALAWVYEAHHHGQRVSVHCVL